MATKYKAPYKAEAEAAQTIRITLTGTRVKEIETFCTALLRKARDLSVKSVRGPRRMPTKKMSITTRKSPCGNGTATWERWEMKIHKRVIDFEISRATLVELVRIKMDPSIKIQVLAL